MRYLCLLAALLSLQACQPEPAIIDIENPLGQALEEAPFVLTRAEVEAKLGPFPDLKYLKVSVGQESIPIQMDDLDGDGVWDEVFGLADIGEDGLSLALEITTDEPESLQARTQIYMARGGEPGQKLSKATRVAGTDTEVTQKAFQFEGPGWENDLVAFRNYFDERNGIDIFGKQVPEMVLPRVGLNASYHELQPWGMDVLKVGNSLGAGSLALEYQGKLYRVNGDSTGTFELIQEGPLRSSFRFKLPRIPVGDTMVSVIHEVSIIAGMPGYMSEVQVAPLLDSLRLVSGIVNMEIDTFYTLQSDQTRILYTHGAQGYDGELLGMALLTDMADQPEMIMAPEEGEGVVQTYGMSLALYPDRPTQLAFLAGWEVRDEEYKERKAFEEMVVREAKKWQARP